VAFDRTRQRRGDELHARQDRGVPSRAGTDAHEPNTERRRRAEFATNVAQIAADLAAGPTHLQAMAKARFHAGWRQSIEECTEIEIENVMRSIAHPYFRKTLDDFLGKRARSDKTQVRLPHGIRPGAA
jgi:hypothetical protein